MHARSGDTAKIADYMGSGSTLDDVINGFAVEHADQNERDYRTCIKRIRKGRIEGLSEA